MLSSSYIVSEDILKCNIEDTSKVFATDMLVLKFIQGLPIIGLVGVPFVKNIYDLVPLLVIISKNSDSPGVYNYITNKIYN